MLFPLLKFGSYFVSQFWETSRLLINNIGQLRSWVFINFLSPENGLQDNHENGTSICGTARHTVCTGSHIVMSRKIMLLHLQIKFSILFYLLSPFRKWGALSALSYVSYCPFILIAKQKSALKRHWVENLLGIIICRNSHSVVSGIHQTTSLPFGITWNLCQELECGRWREFELAKSYCILFVGILNSRGIEFWITGI